MPAPTNFLASLAFDSARRTLRDQWRGLNLNCSVTDAYTDGFYDARDWALARLRAELCDAEFCQVRALLDDRVGNG